jgi:hypothetical protein
MRAMLEWYEWMKRDSMAALEPLESEYKLVAKIGDDGHRHFSRNKMTVTRLFDWAPSLHEHSLRWENRGASDHGR